MGLSFCSVPAIPSSVFQPHFIKNCSGGKGLLTVTCLETVGGVSNMWKHFLSQKITVVSMKLYGDN